MFSYITGPGIPIWVSITLYLGQIMIYVKLYHGSWHPELGQYYIMFGTDYNISYSYITGPGIPKWVSFTLYLGQIMRYVKLYHGSWHPEVGQYYIIFGTDYEIC